MLFPRTRRIEKSAILPDDNFRDNFTRLSIYIFLCPFIAFIFDSRYFRATLTLPLDATPPPPLLCHAFKFLVRCSSSCLPGTQAAAVFTASSRLKGLLRWQCLCGFCREIALFVIKTVLTPVASRTCGRAARADAITRAFDINPAVCSNSSASRRLFRR